MSMEKLHKIADGLLADIRIKLSVIEAIDAAYNEKIASVRATHEAAVTNDKAELAALEKEIVALMKENKAEFFSHEVDRVDLTHGALLHKIRDVVKRSRSITPEMLDGLGYAEAVKILKSVDWDVVDTWPDVRLAEIGAQRRPQEKFEYEIAGDRNGKRKR